MFLIATSFKKGMFLYIIAIGQYIQSVGPLKMVDTSPHGKPIHSGTNLTSLGGILAMQ